MEEAWRSKAAAEAEARSSIGDEVWRLLVEARNDLEAYGQGPEATAVALARNDARTVDRLLAEIEAETAEPLRRATEVAAGWEIPPFERLNAALEALGEAMAEARQASHQALGGTIDAVMRSEFGDDWRKLAAVRPPPTKGLNDLPEKTARRQNFVRLAHVNGVDTDGVEAAEWAMVAVALGIDDPPNGLSADVDWARLRRRWSSAMASARTK